METKNTTPTSPTGAGLAAVGAPVWDVEYRKLVSGQCVFDDKEICDILTRLKREVEVAIKELLGFDSVVYIVDKARVVKLYMPNPFDPYLIRVVYGPLDSIIDDYWPFDERGAVKKKQWWWFEGRWYRIVTVDEYEFVMRQLLYHLRKERHFVKAQLETAERWLKRRPARLSTSEEQLREQVDELEEVLASIESSISEIEKLLEKVAVRE